jgi:uncharacterized cupredoxin-like copper-binding protein
MGEIMMKTFSIVVGMGLSFLLSATSVEAGALREMMMAKKMKESASQSASSTTTTPANAATVTPAASKAQADPKFELAKKKCVELGNKEGSSKFNSCVVTLME